MSLAPILRHGSTDPTDILTYALRKFYGVEDVVQDPTDHSGINEVFRWTRDLKVWAGFEHTLHGLHDTLKISRRLVIGGWDGAAFVFSEMCYAQIESTGVVVRGPGVISGGVRNGAGDYTLTLAHAMATAKYQLFDFSAHFNESFNDATDQAFVKTELNMVVPPTTTVFRIGVYSHDPSPDVSAFDDRPFAFMLHGL